MTRCLAPLAILCLAMMFSGCPRAERKAEASKSAEEHEQIVAVVRAQTDALNKEDLDAALALVDPDSPGFAETKRLSEQLFRTYDIRYTLSEAAVEAVTGNEATVRFMQTTEKLSGPDFRDNRIEGVHVLKRQADGGWKLYTTRADKVVYLDKK